MSWPGFVVNLALDSVRGSRARPVSPPRGQHSRQQARTDEDAGHDPSRFPVPLLRLWLLEPEFPTRSRRRTRRTGIVPRADDRTVGAQAKGVSGPRCQRDDVFPVADVALPVAVVSGCQDPSGRRDSDGVIAARGQRHRVFPLIDVARSGRPVPGREDPPVAPESDGVQVSGCDGREIVPVVNGAALSTAIVSCGQC